MNGIGGTKELAITEIDQLRQRIAELEASAAKNTPIGDDLSEHARLNQILLDSLPPVAMLLRPKTRQIVACNKAGMEVGAVPGKRCFETWGQADKPCSWCLAQKAWETGQEQHLKTWGVGRYWDVHWVPVSDDLYLHYAYDITKEKQTQDALVDSEAKYRSLAESSPDVIMRFDRHCRHLYVSPAVTKIMAMHPEAFIGKTHAELGFPPAECGYWERSITSVFETGEPVETEFSYGQNGNATVFDWRLFPEKDQDGKVTSVLSIARDITERKRAEEELRDSMQLSDDLLRTIPSGIYIYEYKEPDKLFLVDANKAAEELTGIKLCDWKGKEFDEIWPAARDMGLTDTYLNVARTGETFETEDVSYKDERLNAVFLVRAFILPNSRLAIAFEDITERKRAEQKLRESEDTYRQLAENTEAVLWEYHIPSDRWTYVSPQSERILGYRPQEWTDLQFWADHVHQDDRDWATRYCDDCTARGESHEFEYRFLRKDGSVIWVRDVVSVAMRDGSPVTMRGFLIDINARKQAEEERRSLERQVQHAQKLESLGVLAGGIAHDFNNLLTVILGNVDMVLQETAELAPARSSLEDIKTASVRAAELTNQMLAYVGKGQVVVKPVDLNELVQEMRHLLGVSIPKTVILKSDLAPDLPAIDGDVGQMGQVVMNLITNAAEAIGDEEGVISLRTRIVQASRADLSAGYGSDGLAEGQYICLSVSDTGSGMNEETKSKLFDPFFTTKFTGRGLGLSAVLGIVRGHRGTITVEGKPGQGTTFKVFLPLSGRADQGQADIEETPDACTWQASGTVLLVDDEQGVRDIGKRMLERAGLSVLTAGDGAEAVEVFRQNSDQISAVLLDMTMPKMGGVETFRALQAIRQDVPVILTSGYTEQDVTSRFGGKAPAGFVHKPFDLDKLTSTLRDVMGPN